MLLAKSSKGWRPVSPTLTGTYNRLGAVDMFTGKHTFGQIVVEDGGYPSEDGQAVLDDLLRMIIPQAKDHRTMTPLTYTFTNPDGSLHESHAPAIAAQVNGVPTLFLVDTGASDIILLTQLEDIPTRPGEPGTDHAGAPVPTWHADAALSLTIGEHTTTHRCSTRHPSSTVGVSAAS